MGEKDHDHVINKTRERNEKKKKGDEAETTTATKMRRVAMRGKRGGVFLHRWKRKESLQIAFHDCSTRCQEIRAIFTGKRGEGNHSATHLV